MDSIKDSYELLYLRKGVLDFKSFFRREKEEKSMDSLLYHN